MKTALAFVLLVLFSPFVLAGMLWRLVRDAFEMGEELPMELARWIVE